MDDDDAEPWWVKKEREDRLKEITQWGIILLALCIAGLVAWWTVAKPMISAPSLRPIDQSTLSVPQE